MKESASMRIAIVDDAEQERNQLREKLETQLEQDSIYMDITEFDNGAAFLTAAREEAFAAVFLDIYMQGKNGIETKVTSYKSTIKSDALGPEAYDGNESTYHRLAFKATVYLDVDESMQGKKY